MNVPHNIDQIRLANYDLRDQIYIAEQCTYGDRREYFQKLLHDLQVLNARLITWRDERE